MSKSNKNLKVIKAAHGEATGKPSMDSIRSKLQAAIQGDARFDDGVSDSNYVPVGIGAALRLLHNHARPGHEKHLAGRKCQCSIRRGQPAGGVQRSLQHHVGRCVLSKTNARRQKQSSGNTCRQSPPQSLCFF